MDVKRLNALVSLCNAYAADHDAGIAEYLNTADIADLARCAAAWAKMEKLMMSQPHVVELFGYRGRMPSWSFYPGRAPRLSRNSIVECIESAPEPEVGE